MMPGHYAATNLRDVLVHPQGDRLLILPDPLAGKTEGGIVLPDSARGTPTEGTIVAVGPGRETETGHKTSMPYKVGQRVLYAAFSESKLTIDGVEHLIVKTVDIYAVVEPKPAEVVA